MISILDFESLFSLKINIHFVNLMKENGGGLKKCKELHPTPPLHPGNQSLSLCTCYVYPQLVSLCEPDHSLTINFLHHKIHKHKHSHASTIPIQPESLDGLDELLFFYLPWRLVSLSLRGGEGGPDPSYISAHTSLPSIKVSVTLRGRTVYKTFVGQRDPDTHRTWCW